MARLAVRVSLLATLCLLVGLNVYRTLSWTPIASAPKTDPVAVFKETVVEQQPVTSPASNTVGSQVHSKNQLETAAPAQKYAKPSLLDRLEALKERKRSIDLGKLKHHGQDHRVAGLSCPSSPSLDDAAYKKAQKDMVYWRDIEQDSIMSSPYRCEANGTSFQKKYLTFEPDEGGWNNMRIALETVVAMAVVMGRVLVLPPSQHFSRMTTHFGYDDFYHLASIQYELEGLEVMTFQDFLEKEVLTGHLLADKKTGKPLQPPDGRTNWDGMLRNFESAKRGHGSTLWNWWRTKARLLLWDYGKCIATFPEPTSSGATCTKEGWRYTTTADEARPKRYLNSMTAGVNKVEHWGRQVESYNGKPTPVDARPVERMKELLARRKQLCIYNHDLQKAPVVHAMGEQSGTRFLVHFYAFIFLEDWKHDLWLKRFVRDHLRYVDEIQCAAARIVTKLREHAYHATDNPTGSYDTMHVRRGDFTSFYKATVLSGEDLYKNHASHYISEKRVIYIATDEKDRTYFDEMKKHYTLYFLSDFNDLIEGFDKNYYGMLEQAIASTGDVFIGTFYSTFSGYINRLRGYRSQRFKLPGYELGGLMSYYTFGENRLSYSKEMMRSYRSVRQSFWTNEFPVGWRDLDHGLSEEVLT